MAKILFVARQIHTDFSNLGGPARVNHEIRRQLEHNRYPAIGFYDPKLDFWDILRQIVDVDGLHFGDQSPWSSLLALGLILMRTPFTTTLHGVVTYEAEFNNQRSWRARIQQWIMMRYAKRVIVVSPKLLDLLPDRVRRKAVPIPNGCSLIAELKHAEVCVQRRYEHKLRVVTVGGTRAIKGIPFLLESLERVAHSDVQLTIFGKSGADHSKVVDGDWKTEVRYQDVIPRDELLASFPDHDVFVQASSYESFGMAPLEALLSGMPIIITEECGVSQYLTGFRLAHPSVVKTVAYGDGESMARAIMAAYQWRRDDTSVPSCYSVEDLSHLSWSAVADQYADVWAETIRS